MVIAKTLDTLPDRLGVIPGFAGLTLIPDIGHWTQQENAPAVNEALIGYFATLS
jgi:pimeloyl-ACP methyl ester carboxylesterase